MDDSILMKLNVFFCFAAAILMYLSVCFIRGINPRTNKKMKFDNKYKKKLVTIVLPIIIVIATIWYSGSPILDYINKDYQTKVVTIIRLGAQANSFQGQVATQEDGTFYINRKSLKYFDKGEKYEIVYGKRSKVIIEYKKAE